MSERFTLPKPVDRDEWLRARHRDAEGRKWFNASDASIVMGANPFDTLADLAVKYLADEPQADDPNEAQERGQRCEPMLLQWYADKHGVQVITPEVMFASGRLLATIDGQPVGVDGLGIEAKSTQDYWGNQPPESVFWQCVAQTVCTGWDAIDVPWIDASMRFKQHRFVPTDADRDALVRRVDEVLAYIDLGLVPEGAHLTAKHVTSLHPVATTGMSVDLSAVELLAVHDWEARRQERLLAEKAEETAKAKVLALLGDAETADWHGQPVASWKNAKPSERPDWKALEADHPDLVDAYRRVVPGARTLRATSLLGAAIDGLPVDELEEAF